MKLNPVTVGTLFRTELRMLLRDRRTIIFAIVLPVIFLPILLFSSNWTTQRREQTLRHEIYRYAVTGARADAIRAILAAAREYGRDNPINGASAFRFKAVSCTNALTALDQGKIHIILEGLAAQTTRLEPTNAGPKVNSSSFRAVGGTGAKAGVGGNAPRTQPASGTTAVRIIYRGDHDASVAAMNLMATELHQTRRVEQASLLRERRFPVKPSEVAAVSDINVASKAHVAGLELGRILTLLLMLFILVGGTVAAADSVVGEKERGTLETLLTTAANRSEIVAAKHLLILTVALAITAIQVVNLLVYIGFKLIPLHTHFAAAVPPTIGVLLFVLFLPVVALAASVLLLTSSYAKSYKEAQLYFFPVLLLGVTPTLAPFLPGLPLRSAIVLVPVANLAVAAKEILIGVFDWPMIVVSWLVTAAAAVWTTRLSVRALAAEKLIIAGDTDAVEFAGGPALFSRRVLPWYALLWGVLLIVNNYMAALDIRAQLVVNLLVLFLGAAVLMIRLYRLDLKEALALRTPKPAVWLAVLVAVPGGLLTGIGLFRLANLVVPVPSKVIESFSQNVLPPGIPFWQLILFLGVLPGVIEEIMFRGLLLHGLHRRLHPAALALVVGLVFGMFHVALFRLAPAAFLGILLAAVTLLTGSIFPAMLWHALNNIFAILPVTQQLPLTKLDASVYLLGAGLLVMAFWIIWRNRTPYPGLRPWRPPPEKN